MSQCSNELDRFKEQIEIWCCSNRIGDQEGGRKDRWASGPVWIIGKQVDFILNVRRKQRKVLSKRGIWSDLCCFKNSSGCFGRNGLSRTKLDMGTSRSCCICLFKPVSSWRAAASSFCLLCFKRSSHLVNAFGRRNKWNEPGTSKFHVWEAYSLWACKQGPCLTLAPDQTQLFCSQ